MATGRGTEGNAGAEGNAGPGRTPGPTSNSDVDSEGAPASSGTSGEISSGAAAPAIEWRSPWSTNIAAIGHDPARGEIHVRWSRGSRVSIYGPGISAEEADRIMNSASVGSEVYRLRTTHAHRYADD